MKIMVKHRFRRSRTVPRPVEEPSGFVSSLAYCDSRMVQMKLCAQRNSGSSEGDAGRASEAKLCYSIRKPIGGTYSNDY